MRLLSPGFGIISQFPLHKQEIISARASPMLSSSANTPPRTCAHLGCRPPTDHTATGTAHVATRRKRRAPHRPTVGDEPSSAVPSERQKRQRAAPQRLIDCNGGDDATVKAARRRRPASPKPSRVTIWYAGLSGGIEVWRGSVVPQSRAAGRDTMLVSFDAMPEGHSWPIGKPTKGA